MCIRDSGNVNAASGISTFTNLDVNGDSDFDGHTNIDNLSVAGVSTFTGLIDGNGGATIDNIQIGITGNNEIDTSAGNLLLDSSTGQTIIDDNLSVVGVSTFGNIIEAPAGMNKVPSLYMNQSNLPSASNYHGMFAHVHSTGRGYFSHAMNWYELVNKDLYGVVGTGTERYNIGVTTISNLTVSGATNFSGAVNATTIEVPNATVTTKLGVGSTDTPASDIQVTKSGNADIQICGTGGIAALNVGREVGTSKTHTSQIRFGGGAGAPYSSGESLDIINYDVGNFNYHLGAGNVPGLKGDFVWHKGLNSARLMTLTGIGGSLGIGITTPSTNLHVIGAATVSGDVNVGNNLVVAGALLGNVEGTLTGNVQGTLAGNSNTTVGISTLNNLSVAGVATFTTGIESEAVGIGTTVTDDAPLRINPEDNDRFFIGQNGFVGIKTTSELANVVINASQVNASIGQVAVGATVLKSSVDFADAGTLTTRFMLPPKITTSQRGNLTGVIAGALIYNTSTNRLQVFNGSQWRDCNT